jgi:hypothetical protein
MKLKGIKREVLITLCLSINSSECRIVLSITRQNKLETADTFKAKNRGGRSGYINVTETM